MTGKRRKTLIGMVILLTIFFLAGTTSATVFLKNGSEIGSDDPFPVIFADPAFRDANQSIQFFTNTHCGACHGAAEFLTNYSAAHPEIRVEVHDLFDNTENRRLFEEYKLAFNRPYVSTPVVFTRNVGLEGQYAIREYFDRLVKASPGSGGESLLDPLFGLPEQLTGGEGAGSSISIPLIIGAGLLDGINPCAFSVLVFLLIYLLSISNKRRMLLAGLVYTTAVFFFYYLSGVGLFTIIQTTGVVTAFSVFAGCVALLAGMIMIKDALIPGAGPTLGIPESRKEVINRYIEKTTIPAAFILGLLVGMFELPCTGGIYLAIISMISLRVEMTEGLLYLVIYNLAFILPLLIIIALVYFGMAPEKVNEWRVEQRKALRLIIGLILIGCAVLIFLEIL